MSQPALRSGSSNRLALAGRAALACLALLLAAPGLGAQAPPDFVLVTIDTLRADHLGAYGYFRDTSPRFDAFAADAVLVEQPIAPMPTTLPSHVSLLTSSLPARHGVLSNFRFLQIPFVPGAVTGTENDRLASVAQVLGAAGYTTAAFTSASPLSRGTGIDAGFAHFDAPPPFAERNESVRRPADETVDVALAWLADAPRPFFLWVHVFDPHLPYAPPEPYDVLFPDQLALREDLQRRGIPEVLLRHVARITNAYDGEIRFSDAQLGRLLDALRERGLYESSVVVVAGDHGEGLMEHGEPGHEHLWNGTLETPLALRWPGGPRGERVSGPVSLVDVLPTLRAHTRLPLAPMQLDGRDLLDPEAGPAEVLSQESVFASLPNQRTYALTTPRWKYLHLNDGKDHLYDLQNDPSETRDVIDDHPDVARRLRARIEALLADARSRPGIDVDTDIDPALRARLEALGYAD